MCKMLTDNRGVTSLEYGMVAAALALVLIAVMRIPAEVVAAAIKHLIEGAGPPGMRH